MIWAMILAAGESKRMKSPKLLLPFAEKTIIETVVDNVTRSEADKTLVVLGAEQKRIKDKIQKYQVETIVNRNYKKGMLSSVQLGFKTIPDGAEAVLVLLGDQPLIPPSIIDKIIDAFKSSKKGIILPTHDKNRGHPVLIDLKYRGEVESLSPEEGLRGVVYSHPEDTLEVEVDEPSILRDIDTIKDYEKEISNHQKNNS